MSKADSRRIKRADFLVAMLGQAAKKKLHVEKQKYEPPEYKHGFIVKPTNPGWISALERKVRQYKERLQKQPWDDKTGYRLLLLSTVLHDGEVNIEVARKKIKNRGARLHSVSDYYEAESIVQRYCRCGGGGVTSFGGFLPTDSNYDENV